MGQRKPLKRIGKRGRINIEANRVLKTVYTRKGVERCEIKLEGCLRDWTLGFAHRHRRFWYYTHDGIGSYMETVMACSNCHQKIDTDKDLLEKTFKRLRNNVSKRTDNN